MCNYYLINELVLGNRSLGYEFISISDKKSEVVEMTAKTVRDNIKSGKKIHGLQIAGKAENLVLDEKFYMRNYTVKSHINNIRPKYEYEGQCVANIMYIVIGRHEENEKTVYDVVSSRVEKTTFSEEKLKAMYELGFISGGCKIEDDKIILPLLEARVKEIEKKLEQSKVTEAVKAEIKPVENKVEATKVEQKPIDKKVEASKVEDKKAETCKEKAEQKKFDKVTK